MLLCMAVPGFAQTTDKDSVFVVKDGRLVAAYEIGTDIDGISFKKPQAPVLNNSIQMGSQTIGVKSALIQRKSGMNYVYLASEEDVNTVAGMLQVDHLTLVISDDLLGKEISLADFSDENGSYFQNYYIAEGMEDPLGASCYDWEDYYSEGTLTVDKTDQQLNLSFNWTGKDGNDDFRGGYSGSYTFVDESPYYFTVDGRRTDMKAVFCEQLTDGVALYLTSGDIQKANDLANVIYYARVFVPTQSLDGHKINIAGTEEFELLFVDNAREEQISLSTDNIRNAKGSLSVLKRDNGEYEVKIDIEKMGTDADRSLSAYYSGEVKAYDLTLPNELKLGDNTVKIKSAVVSHTDGIYTVYLSAKENVTTLAGMADADAVVCIPDEFMTAETKGFSGTETNAKISITYQGITYSQANCGNMSNPLALGGNVKAKLEDGVLNLEFNVFGIKQYNKTLQGYYSGAATVI